MGPADLPDRFLLIPLLEFVSTFGQKHDPDDWNLYIHRCWSSGG